VGEAVNALDPIRPVRDVMRSVVALFVIKMVAYAALSEADARSFREAAHLWAQR